MKTRRSSVFVAFITRLSLSRALKSVSSPDLHLHGLPGAFQRDDVVERHALPPPEAHRAVVRHLVSVDFHEHVVFLQATRRGTQLQHLGEQHPGLVATHSEVLAHRGVIRGLALDPERAKPRVVNSLLLRRLLDGRGRLPGPGPRPWHVRRRRLPVILDILQKPSYDGRGYDVPDVVRVGQVLERESHHGAVGAQRGSACKQNTSSY